MNTRFCCDIAPSDSGSRPFGARATRAPNPPTFARRCLDIASWFVPSAILTLLPKCPACLAAYVAVGTGVGLSFSTATQLRASLMMLCIACAVFRGEGPWPLRPRQSGSSQSEELFSDNPNKGECIMITTNISLPTVATRAEWLVARRELLAREKELTRRRDAEHRTPRAADGPDRQGLCLRRARWEGESARPV